MPAPKLSLLSVSGLALDFCWDGFGVRGCIGAGMASDNGLSMRLVVWGSLPEA